MSVILLCIGLLIRGMVHECYLAVYCLLRRGVVHECYLSVY